MKTTFLNPKLALLAVGAMMPFAACSSTSRAPAAMSEESRIQGAGPPRLAELAAANWHLVDNEPPTYYPKDIPSDAPTSHRDGEWVYAGENGERWFLPRNGIEARKRSQLRQEALARQTVDQRNAIQRKPREVDAADVALFPGRLALSLTLWLLSYGTIDLDELW